MLSAHPESPIFICPDCDLVLTSELMLEMHQKMTHKREQFQARITLNLDLGLSKIYQ